MKILVAIKRVRDPEHASRIKVEGGGRELDAKSLEWKLNPFDEYALEAALRLTENAQAPKERLGEVLVVSVGPAEVETQLRAALATGATRAIRVAAEDEKLDGVQVARALQALVAREQPDLVLLGKQTVDFESNQVAQLLAAWLDYPLASCAASILEEEPGKLLVTREVDDGAEQLRLRLPCVLSVDLRITGAQSVRSRHTPAGTKMAEGVRFAPLPAIMAAKKKPLEQLDLATLGVSAEAPWEVVGYQKAQERAAGRVLANVDELLHALKTEAKLL